MRSVLLIVAAILLGIGNCAAEIVERKLSYTSDGTELQGLLVYDSAHAGKRPGVLVVHEWWGLNDYAKRRTRMLAELGYVAFAVDMYGGGKTADHPKQAGEFSGAALKDLDAAARRFEAGLALLRKQEQVDPQKIAAIGYCFGGGVVLEMARRGVDLKGVVSFHGSLAAKDKAKPGAIKAKMLVCHGADDKFVPAASVQALKDEMKTAGADLRLVIYPGAKHSFTNSTADATAKKYNLDIAYNEKADRESWAEMQKFFNEIFGSR